MIVLTLPYPPSVNHYYGTMPNGQRYIKAAGKAYRKAVAARVAESLAFARGRVLFATGELAVRVVLNRDPASKPDADNGNKALLDALTHARVWTDDAQVAVLLNQKGEPLDGGAVSVTIAPLARVSVVFEISQGD